MDLRTGTRRLGFYDFPVNDRAAEQLCLSFGSQQHLEIFAHMSVP
jgi:hypothetical protein